MAVRLIPQRRPEELGSVERAVTRRRRWRLRVFHSLTGIVPLGALMVVQLWALAKVSAGPQQLQEAWAGFAWLCGQPGYLLPLGASLLFHAGYGLVLARARPVVGRYPVNGAWMHLFQRVSAVLVLPWLLWPLLALGWPVYRGVLQPQDAASLTRAALSSTAWGVPWCAFGYLLGLAALVFHGFNGLGQALVRWGAVRTARARGQLGLLLALSGCCAFLAAAHGVTDLATGWRAYQPTVAAPAKAASSRVAPAVSASGGAQLPASGGRRGAPAPASGAREGGS